MNTDQIAAEAVDKMDDDCHLDLDFGERKVCIDAVKSAIELATAELQLEIEERGRTIIHYKQQLYELATAADAECELCLRRVDHDECEYPPRPDAAASEGDGPTQFDDSGGR